MVWTGDITHIPTDEFRRRPPPGLIFHSDRRSQYCAREFQDTLKAWEIRSSMSRKGDCWDNAHTESLWGHLKTACVHGRRFATREQARLAILNWIGFYNHARLHSTLGDMSPMQYERTLVGGAAESCRLRAGLRTPFSRGNLSSAPAVESGFQARGAPDPPDAIPAHGPRNVLPARV